jgi:hypothetical protein
MSIKESRIAFANELTHSFQVGVPDITSRSIRIPAFDFSVFEAGREYGKYYESAILVFEDVVSSTRHVKPFRHEPLVEGQGTYEVKDGPVDLVDSNQEVFHSKIDVYANRADAWVEWDIVAASVRVEEIDKEVLIDLALKRGVKSEIVKSALEDVERKAVEGLLHAIDSTADHELILPVYTEELIEAAKRKNRVLEIADLLIQKPNRALLKLADKLSTYHTQGCASLIRDIIAAGYDASGAMMATLYHDDGGIARALLDPSEPVRIHAAKIFESRNDIAGLILCLQNDSARVREIAGWYMGIKKVGEAADALVKAITTKKFTGVLTYRETKALRSAIWALGVLRINTMRPYLEPLTKHDNKLIRKTALDALSKLP